MMEKDEEGTLCEVESASAGCDRAYSAQAPGGLLSGRELMQLFDTRPPHPMRPFRLARKEKGAASRTRAAPVQSCKRWHARFSSGLGSLTRAGRSCGSLTDRRSGWQALALHPV